MNAQKAGLANLIATANNIANDARSTFGRLSLAQLNWKPSADRWSVAQCFDHLISSNKGYFPVIEDVLAGKKRTFWERIPGLPGLAGKLLIKSMEPTSTRKVKAPKRFQPSQSDISASVIDDFAEQQGKLVEKMRATEHIDLENVIITSPVSAAITYSLMDAYRLIVVHEQRHYQQAKRVMEESAFPG
jgi:DinB superfamily